MIGKIVYNYILVAIDLWGQHKYIMVYKGLTMQNYVGQFKLNGQEYFYRAKDDSKSTKITKVNDEEHHYRIVEIINSMV